MSSEIVKASLPAELAAYTGAGSDQFDDVTIAPPLVKLLQKTSPEVDAGSQPGTFQLSQVGTELGREFTASVLGFQVRHTLWKPRNDREREQWEKYGLNPDAPEVLAAPDRIPLWSRRPSELSASERAVATWDNAKGAPPAGAAYHFALAIESDVDGSVDGYIAPVRAIMGKTSAKHGQSLARLLKIACGKAAPIFLPRVAFGVLSAKNPSGSHFEWKVSLTTPQGDVGKLRILAAMFDAVNAMSKAYEPAAESE